MNMATERETREEQKNAGGITGKKVQNSEARNEEDRGKKATKENKLKSNRMHIVVAAEEHGTGRQLITEDIYICLCYCCCSVVVYCPSSPAFCSLSYRS